MLNLKFRTVKDYNDFIERKGYKYDLANCNVIVQGKKLNNEHHFFKQRIMKNENPFEDVSRRTEQYIGKGKGYKPNFQVI
jgi:hypothetical protein